MIITNKMQKAYTNLLINFIPPPEHHTGQKLPTVNSLKKILQYILFL